MDFDKTELVNLSQKINNHSTAERQYAKISGVPFCAEILNSIPQFAAVINNNREIVFANKSLLESTGIGTMFEILGMRPGEAISCTCIYGTEYRCGTTETCQYCEAINAVIESMEKQTRVEKECRITLKNDNGIRSIDFMVTASPIEVDGEIFTLITMIDISGHKRKEVLERIFFHDILNTLNGLSGYIEILRRQVSSDEIRGIVDDISILSVSLIDDINAQRDLLAAERGDLHISPGSISSSEIIDYCISHVRHTGTAELKYIVREEGLQDISFISDETILKRIIINMLKNALEAVSEGDEVHISCCMSDSGIVFSVKNNGIIPEDVQSQIFQRSFSTKGKNRGLGTYSMRILTENYLKGRVWFKSDKETGTSFMIELPL